MKKVVVKRSKYEKREYDIQCGEAKDIANGVWSHYCTIRASNSKKLLGGHYLIEAFHSLGGGSGGWDSYKEIIDVANNKKDVPKQLRLTAVAYARRLAKRLGATLENKL